MVKNYIKVYYNFETRKFNFRGFDLKSEKEELKFYLNAKGRQELGRKKAVETRRRNQANKSNVIDESDDDLIEEYTYNPSSSNSNPQNPLDQENSVNLINQMNGINLNNREDVNLSEQPSVENEQRAVNGQQNTVNSQEQLNNEQEHIRDNQMEEEQTEQNQINHANSILTGVNDQSSQSNVLPARLGTSAQKI